MPLDFNENILEKFLNKKIRIAALLITLSFLFIFFRLYYLQILKGNKFAELSTNNRIRITKIPAPRGIIFSKNKDIFVTNNPSFDLNLIPQDTVDHRKILDAVASLLNINRVVLQKKFDSQKGRPPFEPITLKKELSWEEMSLVLSKKMDLQGISIDVVPKRLYCGEMYASHIFGFLGEVDKNEMLKHPPDEYILGDLIGKFGLEKWGEKYLHGQRGGQQSEVDAYGNRQKVLAEIDPAAGCNVTISLVPHVQKTAEDMLKDKTGTVVAMNPQTGELIALASSPGFDANLFARGIDSKEWERLTKNSRHPLLNRAIQTQQPPGSVFKIVTAIAALEEKAIDPNAKIFCPGYLSLGSRSFGCWKKHGHGLMNMHEAIVQSCDVYFYTIGLRVGIDNIHKYATMFGLGAKTGFELEGEKPGLIPSQEWKKNKFSYPWQKGETLNTAIGQGFVLCTPLQLANFFCGIANGTHIPKPRIVLAVDCENKAVAFEAEKIKALTVSPATLSFIRDALTGVVNEPSGTGSKAKIPNILVGGKTGTAQVISKRSVTEKYEDTPWLLQDHAWFVSFAPTDKPEIVVSVFVEHGGHGGSVAAPIAKHIIESYLVQSDQTKTFNINKPAVEILEETEED